MRKMNIKFAVALLCGAAFAAPTLAMEEVDKSGTNFSDTAAEMTESGKAVETLSLGYKLAEYARTAEDPRAMIVAARMVGSIPVSEAEEKGAIEGEGAGEEGDAGALPSGDALFAEARDLAAGDPDILAEIDMAQGEGSKGVVGGAIGTTQYVPGQTVWTVRFNARGGEPLVIGTKRGSYAEVDLKVFDENGNLVCQDLSHDVVLACQVNPIWTGAFKVQVINHGNSGSAMALVTN